MEGTFFMVHPPDAPTSPKLTDVGNGFLKPDEIFSAQGFLRQAR
jgi:hypothetical protein